MLTYLHIAIGGAIGSVARAWVTNVMVQLAGAEFPWGTILINITGSFVIGLFGALTAADGRFQVPVDIRTFVMVGICGGYTTFSSFSLQTLDLMRDGKPIAALANVGFSVLLCLLAVAAGYKAALVVNNGAGVPVPQLKPAAQRSMGDVALAILDRPEAVTDALASAARLLPGGRIQALAVKTPPVPELMIADQPMTAATEQRLREKEQSWAQVVRAKVEGWTSPGAGAKAKFVDFIEEEGEIGHLVAQYGRRSNVIVTPGGWETARARHALHAALFDTSRPVLVAPPRSAAGDFGRSIAVAWKDDLSATKALLAAMPLLARADAVHVLLARVDKPAAPPILAEHGVAAKAHAVEGQGPIGALLLQKAHELGADLIVMGAYAHGEWREALLGGVTRYMLDHADLPLFMRH